MPTECGTDLHAVYSDILPRRPLATDLASCTWINNTLRNTIGRLNTLCMEIEALPQFTRKDIERLHKARILRGKIHHAINERAPALERISVDEYCLRTGTQTALIQTESRIDFLYMENAACKDEDCDTEPLPSANAFDAMFPGFPVLATEVQAAVQADMSGVREQVNDYWLERRQLNSTITDDYREAKRFLDVIRAEKLENAARASDRGSMSHW